MRKAGTNQPVGSAYNRAFGDWMAERPWARNTDKATRNHLLWVADHRSEIEAWRATLSQSERDKMNHPTTLRRKWDAAHRPTAADPKARKKETKVEALQRENAELWDKVKRMERDGGSLFDLNQTLGQGHRQDHGRAHGPRQADAAATGDRQGDRCAQG